jgi:hypothetical protein
MILFLAAEIDRTISRELAFGKLCTGFAAFALLTACVGLCRTVSYSVARRVGEIGIRMAQGGFHPLCDTKSVRHGRFSSPCKGP